MNSTTATTTYGEILIPFGDIANTILLLVLIGVY